MKVQLCLEAQEPMEAARSAYAQNHIVISFQSDFNKKGSRLK